MDMISGKERARILSEALPFIRRYHGQTVVVKIGGSALVKTELLNAFARDVSLLAMVGVRIVVIHGGGPQIAAQLAVANIPERKHHGLRITDHATLQIVEKVLGDVNRDIVAAINSQGAHAVSFESVDTSLLCATRYVAQGVDYGLVGTVREVAFDPSRDCTAGHIPVIAPLGTDDKGQSLNINADEAAAAIAAKCHANVLLMLTDTNGVVDRSGRVASELTAAQLSELMEDQTVNAGMVPKVTYALSALAQGVGSCRILNGTSAHPLLLDLLTDQGVGTMIKP